MSPVSIEEVKERAKKIKLVILDVHGVMTDEIVYYSDNGVRYRPFCHRDGLANYALMWGGMEVAWLTRSSKTARFRAQELKIKRYYENPKKVEKLDELEQELGLKDDEVCYVGDDLIDLGVMNRVGLAVAPSDAVPEAKEAAHYITETPSGKGVVREIAELILKAQGKWEEIKQKIMTMGY